MTLPTATPVTPAAPATPARFTNMVALVTGASRGMGAAFVRALVAEGACVVAGDVLDDEGELLAKNLDPAVRYVHLDVSSEADWQHAVDVAEREFGPVAVLVNNAGILAYGTVEDTDPDTFRRVLDVNLTGQFLGMHTVVPSMRRAGGGSIVNVSSTAGLMGYSQIAAYVASKWGVRGLTKAAALELGRDGIRVNSVHPGPIVTPMTADADPAIAAEQPVPRFGEPEEVARMVAFLASTDASYCTGHEFVVDGGQAVGRALSRPE